MKFETLLHGRESHEGLVEQSATNVDQFTPGHVGHHHAAALNLNFAEEDFGCTPQNILKAFKLAKAMLFLNTVKIIAKHRGSKKSSLRLKITNTQTIE